MRAPRTTSLATIAGLAMVVATASGVAAQNPSLAYPYPANDTPLTSRTQACLELRERSTGLFDFVRGADVTWVPAEGRGR